LLEGLVFGHKIGSEVEKLLETERGNFQLSAATYSGIYEEKNIDVDAIRLDIQEIMTDYVGIVRDKKGLAHAKNKISEYYDGVKSLKNTSVKHFELQNILLLSKLVIESALKREESRGAHYRSDYNRTDDENWKKNIIVSEKELENV
jgi:L-aspartate oxidase